MVVVGPRERDAPDDVGSADTGGFPGLALRLPSSAPVEDVEHGPADVEERRARVAPDGGLTKVGSQPGHVHSSLRL